ncbi:MAG TPA: dihydrodipicolinate synthase family protein [Opitutaceae bacterium]|nr:dihydrodipicolinate synthase family protein [Opitutaceae bacterium]
MTTDFKPGGIYSAQWIPTGKTGGVDRDALAEHLAYEREAGIAGVLALGSTGEFPHFSPAERKHVLATVAELAAPLPVIANITDIRPRVSVELGQYAKSLGLPVVALMPPMFYPVSPADMLAYFLHVAERVGLPVMLYNFPELTGKRIDLATIAAFADRAPMAAIKQSGAEFEYHRELVALGREKNFVVMSGADTRLPEAFGLGVAGCIGGLVNFVPEWMVTVDRVHRQRLPGDATAAAAALRETGTIIDQLTFPVNVAAGLESRGFRPGAPKSVLSPESTRVYAKVMADLKALYARTDPALAA